MLPYGEDGTKEERETVVCIGVYILGHMGHMGHIGQDNMGLYLNIIEVRSLTR
jgi:hypothetical protein